MSSDSANDFCYFAREYEIKEVAVSLELENIKIDFILTAKCTDPLGRCFLCSSFCLNIK